MTFDFGSLTLGGQDLAKRKVNKRERDGKTSEQLQPRPESEILLELSTLCVSPGYVHALAFLAFRDTMISIGDTLSPEAMLHLSDPRTLIRTELSTLAGFLVTQEVDFTLPPPAVTQANIDRTESLLMELHKALVAPMNQALSAAIETKSFDYPFAAGNTLREPIFYCGESAYAFQYRDFSVKKYSRDEEWLLSRIGFSIETAREVVRSTERWREEKIQEFLNDAGTVPPDEWTWLPTCQLSVSEIASYGHIRPDVVARVLSAFSLPPHERNASFDSLQSFNVINALPLIPGQTPGEYILFSNYFLAAALYESPFYWMSSDRSYFDQAMRNRGEFTEVFASECLAKVFGVGNVQVGVDVFDPDSTKVGEIDVLVRFGDRAILLQAKSKRMTLEARKGNDQQIRGDFKKSVQDSYDQAVRCARCLAQPSSRKFVDRKGQEVSVPENLRDIYVLCVVSDHYPALASQARAFLSATAESPISLPLVLDVFTLDAICEMLDSPLRVLSYLDRRIKYAHRIVASHEITILSYHLKRNLWLDEEVGMLLLADDISTDIDAAMIVRREGLPGAKTPEGVLTRLRGTTIGNLLEQIEREPSPGTLGLGYHLLSLSEDAALKAGKMISEVIRRTRKDGKSHDFTMVMEDSGLTVHCTDEGRDSAGQRIHGHCQMRKYIHRAGRWFGIVLDSSGSLRFGLDLEYEWEREDSLESLAREQAEGEPLDLLATRVLDAKSRVGRNDACPCGSGKKFKRCCRGK